jgi:hypothetical protein
MVPAKIWNEKLRKDPIMELFGREPNPCSKYGCFRFRRF